MAMLSEPRRKQKWSLDPRNSAWSKDESKFGQKMLERMGWSKGKGLGAKEQGATEHIKVQVKNNTLGLGAAINHEDNWIAHQDDFNQLLAELNNCHGQGKTEPSECQQKKTFSLEEKSKASRKRVHYMKFAKGKDLSSRSDTDLACIFGKRQKKKKQTSEEDANADSTEEVEKETRNRSSNAVPAISGTTITSALSVKEYFAKRMTELKKSQDKTKVKDTETCLAGTSLEDAEKNSRASEELEPRSKKKKKHSKGKDNSEVPQVEHSIKHGSESEDQLERSHLESQIKKKKKKHKARKRDEEGSTGSFVENASTHLTVYEEQAFHEKDSGLNQKKKKKKRKQKAIECDEDQGDGSKRKKKKKYHVN